MFLGDPTKPTEHSGASTRISAPRWYEKSILYEHKTNLEFLGQMIISLGNKKSLVGFTEPKLVVAIVKKNGNLSQEIHPEYIACIGFW
jgi:hypothetical protein